MSALEHRTDTFTDREAFVWLGFRRDASLNFRVTLPRDKDETRRILEAVGGYNRFDPNEAYGIVDGWWEYVMRFEIAREGSVAFYATFPHWQHQTLAVEPTPGRWINGDGIPVTDGMADIYAGTLVRELREIGADETSYNPRTRELRAWWD